MKTWRTFILLLFLVACNLEVIEDEIEDIEPTYQLDIGSGDNQFNATTDEELENQFEVQLTDTETDKAVEGVVIRFEVKNGDGSFEGNPYVSVPTNSAGRASANLKIGSQLLDTIRVEAQLADNSEVGPVWFTALADRFIDPRNEEEYRVVRLKDGKVWMAENLNYQTEDSWCYNNSANCVQFGRLYIWRDVVATCPLGWRLPLDEEWEEMVKQYGGVYEDNSNDGKAAYKELIVGGESGFDAQLGGWRFDDGGFYGLGLSGAYWSATETNSNTAWAYYFSNDNSRINRGNTFKAIAKSCRCVLE